MSEHGITHSRSQALVDFAYRFAKEAHGDQKRKYTGDPYITHPVRVAQLVAAVTDDVEMICAALLHDVVEDTEVTIGDIDSAGFGVSIAILVNDLTDISKPSDGNRATRKHIDRMHTAQASRRAKTVKLADLIDNSCSIVVYDPDFARVYMHEKEALLEHLKEGDPTLYALAYQIVMEYKDAKNPR